MESNITESIESILKSTSLLSMATVNGKKAHINTAFFAYDENFYIYFLSDSKSQHIKNIKNNNSVAVTVYTSNQTLADKLKGIQIFGTCKQANGKTLLNAFLAYSKRHSIFRKEIKKPIDLKLWGSKLYCIKPEYFKILDEKVFGVGKWVEVKAVR
ncbi:pyridoxamine 5'-phosphate oxidase family protein [Candidatus Dojkabacteria bacterium]|nr:pyridoxamine 5'-phosphate oxidase family protein [Candidatus Dojkabacteria bacterium]